jgi:phage tail-like protein
MKYNNIVLKRGYTRAKELYEWRKKVMDGKTQRASGSIVLLDEARNEALRWNFREGWPSKWEGPALNAKTSEVAIETLEIAHEGLELA